MRGFVPPKCRIVQVEVCNPSKVPPKKPPPPPPPPPPQPPGCKVVQNRIDMCCPNIVSFPKTIKVPVVLAELDLQICIDVDVTLEQPALEIKRVKKDVSLDQCKLVPTSFKNHFKLFISGFIRKNIEYATARQVNTNANAICGSILHTTAHVPFSCCTEVIFEGENFPEFLVSSDTEARFLDKSGKGSKLDQKLFGHSVHYNEQPYCELVAFEINEFDFAKLDSSTRLPHIPKERTFQTLQEQIVLDLLVKVLQLQQIPIPSKHDHEEECEKECDHDHDEEEECCDHSHEKKCKKHKKKCNHDYDEEECCDHGHEKKCKKKRKKKCEYEVEYEEKWDCDHEEECCDHEHEKKCKKKHEKKCDYDHEEECCDHGHEKKCKKKHEKKCDHDHEEECCDHDHEKKCKKKHEKKRDHDHEEECCDHGHEKKCKKKHEKKCDHDHEEECYDHDHEKKCKEKHEKKCDHDHDEEDECFVRGHKKKCEKIRKKKLKHDHTEKCERRYDRRQIKKSKKKFVGKDIKKSRKKRRKDC